MSHAEPTLLLTRPEPESRAFLTACETVAGHRIPAIISPLMRIEPVGDLPDLDRYRTLIFTSGNGVRSVAARGFLTGRSVCTVGAATADLAATAGAIAVSLGENAEAFLRASGGIESPVLVCRGVHARGSLADNLRQNGIEVDEAVLYDQVAVPLSTAARRLLGGHTPVVAPVFSPRTARLLGGHGMIAAPLTVIAMSSAVAQAWDGPGRILVAESPTLAAMTERTVGQI